ncbi:trigger factor [Patescibacteria group bacterium]|nr:trigger factor [Patescibacteria group bacterium]MBU1673142.1 trigger factor [Patescibacteria group bacterium]MBU1963402.1 trigger factor [Patescibacteria group bacterium]
MKVDKKELPKKQIELLVELTPEELQPYLDQAVKKISEDVDIPGFRKGKVPFDVLKKNVGEATIYEEAFYQAVNKTLPQIVIDEKIDFIGQPKVDAEKIAPGNPLIYKAIVTLMPEVKLGDYKTLKSKKQEVKPDKEKVENTFEDLKKMQAKEKVVLRAAKNDDKVEVDFEIKMAGVPIEGGSGKNTPIIIGEKKFIPGFEEAMLGMKAGDEKDFKVSFPKDYFQKTLAGQEHDAHIKVLNVYERSLPEIDDDFAKALNFQTVDEMKKKIEENIAAEVQQKEDERFELAILEEIMEKSEFDEFSDDLINAEVDKMMHELKHQVEDSGGKFEDYLKNLKKTEDEVKEGFKPKAEKRLKTALISREVARAELVKIEDEEIDSELEKIKQVYGQMPEMQKQFEAPEYRNYIGNMLTNRKVFEKLASIASGDTSKNEDKPAEKEAEKKDEKK